MTYETLRLVIVCAGGPLAASLIAAWWDAHKAKMSARPVKLKLRKGVWVPATNHVSFINRVMVWYGRFAALVVAIGLLGSVIYYAVR